LLVVVACLAPAAARAQDDAFSRAEREYTAGRWAAAEPLYRLAARSGSDARRATCQVRLLHIYTRLGRLDRAVQSGLRARELLLHGDDRRMLREVELRVGECYQVLGHYTTGERHLERALDPKAPGEPMSPVAELEAMRLLARGAERRGDTDAARRWWARVERTAVHELDDPDRTLPERVRLAWSLADSYRFQKRPGPAVERLLPLLAVHDRLGDRPGKRDTLRRLAGHYALQGETRRAEECLRRALDLHEDTSPAGKRLRGEMAEELSEVLARQKRDTEAQKWQREAAEAYAAVIAAGGPGRAGSADAVPAFWRLQQLYQKASLYPQALRVAETQADAWAGSVMLDPRVKSELGALRALRGAVAGARDVLRDAVAELEAQTTPDLINLPRALNNLAAVEQATGNVERAEELARRCLELYRRHGLPEDLVVVEAHNLLGGCDVEAGRYSAAVGHFRAGADLCRRLGREADAARCTLLLNLALLHKSQAEYALAARVCTEARDVFRRLPGADALGLAAFDAALAGLYATQGKIDDAYALVPGLLEVCRLFEVSGGVLPVTALHCQGLYRLARRDWTGAVASWEQVRKLQEKEKQPLLLPRTFNYLGLAAELQGRPADAETLFGRARELQKDNPRAFPVTHFITLWRLAGLAERRGQHAEARSLLEQAVALVEAARLRTYGASEQRSGYFAQFAPGFEQLVQFCLRDGDVDAAVAAVTRGRSRTLLDQLQLADVDPRAELHGPDGDRLKHQEEQLRRAINGLRARAQSVPLEALDEPATRKLLAALDAAQRDYSRVWKEILDASPLYHNLSADLSGRTLLPTLRDRAIPKGTLLLVYHLGPRDSHLMILGGNGERPEAFALNVPAAVADRLASLPAGPGDKLTGLRGLRLRPLPAAGGKPAELAPGKTVPLTAPVARDLVDHYVRQLADPNFRPTRGLKLTPARPDQPLAVQPGGLLADVFLPAEVRRRVRDSGARRLVVVPDGALHKLPLEALVVEAGERPRYVLDELPPIVYAPSAAVLTLLADRPRPSSGAPLTLLTVCNPAYPPEKATEQGGKEARRGGVLGLRGQLPPLPGTAQESRRIRALFDPALVTAIEGPGATEPAVAKAVAGKRFIHLAAHAFADDHFGNLFGAVALTPPAKPSADEDGFLSLHEIYRLPLRDCELAVLSACVTNVGPQQPLEAGMTLATGFLAAGARRVVASHWSVDDEATAALMEAFFKEVTAAAGHGEAVDYATALNRARLAVRERAGWSAPFYWAPFVLLGAAD
jgi:CHAT domain-containing protein/tetratricopeptide (TPR) repeat protein